jgi:hypothetical protein
MTKLISLFFAVALGACAGAMEEPVADAVPVDAPPAQGLDSPTPPAADAPPACPRLLWGTRLCVDGPPECQTIAPPGQESGLHCLVGYEEKLRVPCFCVGAHGPDFWCLRDGAFES